MAPRRRDEALDFARWFTKSKFDLMAGFMADLARPPAERDAADLARRFKHALRHAKRVLRARLVVTVLLAAGLIATLAAALARFLAIPPDMLALVDRAAALSASLTVLLLVARLGFDRYLELIETSATFLAMQLATARYAAREPG